MPRRAATITQADVARIIRAAKQAGARQVTVEVNGVPVIVDLQSTASEQPLEEKEEIVL
jgi:hypothetical protein